MAQRQLPGFRVRRPPEREPEPLYLPLLDPRGPQLEDDPDEDALEEPDSSVIVIELA